MALSFLSETAGGERKCPNGIPLPRNGNRTLGQHVNVGLTVEVDRHVAGTVGGSELLGGGNGHTFLYAHAAPWSADNRLTRIE